MSTAPNPTALTSRAVGDFPIKDKIILVTGGGSGISLAYARLAYEAGASILIVDRALHADATTLVESSNGRVQFQKTDVTDWTALKAAFEQAQAVFKDVPDVVINGAGIFEPPWSSFWEDTEDMRYANVDINCSALFKVTRMAMKAMISHNKKGVVLNIASSGGLTSNYLAPMYCATKFAVVGFSRGLAPADQLEGVKVVAVCPGAVRTPLWTADKAKLLEGYGSRPILLTTDVARVMHEVVTEAAYPGGSIVEVCIDEPTGKPMTHVHDDIDRAKAFGGWVAVKASLERGEVHPSVAQCKAIMDRERAAGPWPS